MVSKSSAKKTVEGDELIHELKLNHKFWEPVISGNKNFEIRKNDRGFREGEHIRFYKVNDNGEILNNEKSNRFLITYVLSGWGVEQGYVALAIHVLGSDS